MDRQPPEFKEMLRRAGAKGGKAKVPKGFARMNHDRLKEVSAKGGKNRHAKQTKQDKDLLRVEHDHFTNTKENNT